MVLGLNHNKRKGSSALPNVHKSTIRGKDILTKVARAEKKKQKRKTIPRTKALAWAEFSKYIRLKDCLVTTGTKDRGKCFTCGKVYPFKKLQAGHFIDGRNATILFDERLVHAQCYACNVIKHGNKDEYTPKMIERFGMEEVQEMWVLAKQSKHWSVAELEDIRDYYKEEYKTIYDNN